jgi:hypothetical protein
MNWTTAPTANHNSTLEDETGVEWPLFSESKRKSRINISFADCYKPPGSREKKPNGEMVYCYRSSLHASLPLLCS